VTEQDGGPGPAELDELVRPKVLGALIAETLHDSSWKQLSASLIAGGKSNLTFELSSPAGQLILRRPPSGKLLPSAHDMGREVRVQTALASSAIPVPEIVAQDATSDLLGVPFYVMRKVAGHVIRDEMPAGYAGSARERRAIADALIDTLAELHAVEPDRVGLSDFGRPVGFLDRQLRRWRSQWEASRTAEVPAIDALGHELEKSLPRSPRHAIVHGDFRLDNCLMHPTDVNRVAGVLDWEMSTLGDPLTDLGLLLFYWRQTGEQQISLAPTATVLPGFPDREYLVHRYADVTNIDPTGIGFYEAFAHFKFAVIAQGIAARVAAGSMAGQDFGDLSEEILRIVDAGRKLLPR
jgi:aminoglycoside phosphotransferase (APT) family kinase protein